MARITTVSRVKWKAVFNKRVLLIHDEGGSVKATDTNTNRPVEGAELASVKNLLNWHRRSQRDTSELPTLWTVN